MTDCPALSGCVSLKVGNNSANANRLLDRLEFLQQVKMPTSLFDDVLEHCVVCLRRQGERYFADGLRGLPDDRRHAILAVCAFEWRGALADAVVETHDRIVGKTWREGQRLCDARIEMRDRQCSKHYVSSGIWVQSCWRRRAMADLWIRRSHPAPVGQTYRT